jgi:hypothetical protein
MATVALGTQSGSDVVTLSADLSGQASGQDARLWIPCPLSNAHQIILDITITVDFAASVVSTDHTFGTSRLYAAWPKRL